MPWVSLFEVFPDAVFEDSEGRPLPHENGRVTFNFPDSGVYRAGVYLSLEKDQIHRVALENIVASAVGTEGSSIDQTFAGIYSEEENDFHENVHGAERIEFNEIPWRYIDVEVYRPEI